MSAESFHALVTEGEPRFRRRQSNGLPSRHAAQFNASCRCLEQPRIDRQTIADESQRAAGFHDRSGRRGAGAGQVAAGFDLGRWRLQGIGDNLGRLGEGDAAQARKVECDPRTGDRNRP